MILFFQVRLNERGFQGRSRTQWGNDISPIAQWDLPECDGDPERGMPRSPSWTITCLAQRWIRVRQWMNGWNPLKYTVNQIMFGNQSSSAACHTNPNFRFVNTHQHTHTERSICSFRLLVWVNHQVRVSLRRFASHSNVADRGWKTAGRCGETEFAWWCGSWAST